MWRSDGRTSVTYPAYGRLNEIERRLLEGVVTPSSPIVVTPTAVLGAGFQRLAGIEHPRVEDTLLNQVLLGGLVLGGRVTNDVDLRAQVKRLAKMLNASVTAQKIDGAVMAEVWR
jgi:hypothetical protein